MTVEATKGSWRDQIAVHSAADVFPLMSPDELQELADDIKVNGLQVPVTFYVNDRKIVVIDGRNRLDALESLGWVLGFDAEDFSGELYAKRPGEIEDVVVPAEDAFEDPTAFVISANIRRRHLTKQQRADLIVQVIKASENDSAKLARSFSPDDGKRGGSTKDPVRLRVVEEAAKHGISERTAQRAMVEAEPERKRKGVTRSPAWEAVSEASRDPNWGRGILHPADKTPTPKAPADKGPNPKQALKVLKGIANQFEWHVAAYEMGALGDLERLVADPAAQEDLDRLKDATQGAMKLVRKLEQHRAAVGRDQSAGLQARRGQ